MTPDIASNQGLMDRHSSARWQNIKIVDSTLREGEQFSSAFFTTDTKLAIARALDNFGVEYIEVTNPRASPQSQADCERICALPLKKSKVIAHIRCHMDDARLAVQCGVFGVNVLMATCLQLRRHSHGKDMIGITISALEVTRYLQSCGVEVRFSCEDSFRSDPEDIMLLYQTLDDLKVDRVGIADTVGVATPLNVFPLVARLRNTVSCDIEVHFHNDIGCAVGNAICAVEAGATHIDTTVLGIGERNGITPLGAFVAAMMTKDRTNVLLNYKTRTLQQLESLVAAAAGIIIPFNNCVTGSAAFSHKAGIHTKAVLRDPATYEILRPDDFGVVRKVHVASRLTGWNAIKYRARQLGVMMSDAEYRSCATLIKAAADHVVMTDDELDDMIRSFPV